MLDIYWRLYEDEEAFFLPHDLEMSNQELSYICRRSEQWRGEEGERRKVAVYDYIWEEETVCITPLNSFYILCRIVLSSLSFFRICHLLALLSNIRYLTIC